MGESGESILESKHRKAAFVLEPRLHARESHRKQSIGLLLYCGLTYNAFSVRILIND